MQQMDTKLDTQEKSSDKDQDNPNMQTHSGDSSFQCRAAFNFRLIMKCVTKN